MTQEELAEEMCTTKSMISYYENDHGDIKQSMNAEFAVILGVRGKMILPSFGKEFFPSTVSRFFSSR